MAEQEAQAPKPVAPQKLGFFRQGTFLHAALWTERSGGTLAFIVGFFQFVIPLHGIETWPSWAILLVAGLFVAVGFWYPAAQSNAIQLAASSQGAVNPQQVNRDFLWSIVPVFVIGAMVLLTIVAGALLSYTTVLDGDGWLVRLLRDRMIISPAMAFFSALVLWSVKVDLGNNNATLTEVVQLAGQRLRFERRE